MNPIRVAVCADFLEEGWPSMDRVAEQLAKALAARYPRKLHVETVRPAFRARVGRLFQTRAAANFDRGLNRLADYPRHLSAIADRYDVFHIVDHSYSQLVHSLPANRTIVTCHDLDTFRSVLRPHEESRPLWFKAMTRRILGGMKAAACVTCDTAVVREELITGGIVSADRTIVAPVGVCEQFSSAPNPVADEEARRLVDAPPGSVELLHVGSTIPRKRIDVLLGCCAGLRRLGLRVHLVRVGGDFSPEQQRLLEELQLTTAVRALPPLTDAVLAAVYRRAALVLLPSDREGFGLPLVEAMASGTPVLATGLPALREVGGKGAAYCSTLEIDSWVRATAELMAERERSPDRWLERRRRGVTWAQRFTWAAFADRLASVYEAVFRGRVTSEHATETCPA